jgi:hypothetical protein
VVVEGDEGVEAGGLGAGDGVLGGLLGLLIVKAALPHNDDAAHVVDPTLLLPVKPKLALPAAFAMKDIENI